MARAVVDIDVNDQAFKDFVEKFAAYKEGLAKLPGIWNEVNDAASEGGNIIGGATAEILSQNAALRAQAEAHDRIGQARATSARRNAPTLPTGPLFDVGGATRVRQEGAPATPPGVGAPREGGAAGEGATLGLDTAALASGLALFEKMEAEKKKITAEDAKSDKAQTEADKKSAKAMADRKKAADGLVKDTQKITKGVADATLSLMKWATIGLGTGLLGGGGLLFGLDRMAQNIGDTRRTAQGLNISTGDLRAFGLTYQRLIDPQQFLGGVNEAMHDITSPGRIGLLSAGLSPGMIAGQDTGQVSIELLDRIRAIAKNTPDQLMGNMLKARHFDAFGIDTQTAERLKITSDQEWSGKGGMRDQLLANQKAMAMQDAASKQWQDFAVQLHVAGQTIEVQIAKKFATLAPEISGLSKAVTDTIGSLLDGIKPADIDALGQGIKNVGAWIKGIKPDDIKAFWTNVDHAAEAVGAFGDKLYGLAKWLGWIPNDKNPDGSPVKPGEEKYGLFGNGLTKKQWDADDAKKAENLAAAAKVGKWMWDAPGVTLRDAQGAIDTFSKMMGRESGNRQFDKNGNTITSPKGALGVAQVMPKTGPQAAALAGLPWDAERMKSDKNYNLALGQAYYKWLLSRYGGDPAKAAAAYNAGPGTVDKDIKNHGDMWKLFLPEETKNYIKNVAPNQQASTSVAPKPMTTHTSVTIINTTGGNAAASVNQVAV